MIDLIFAIVTVLSSPSLDTDGEALRRTVRNYAGVPVHGGDARPFSLEDAVDHVVHARVAAVFTGTEADDLLSIGHHESRLDPSVATNEGPGMWYSDDGAGPGAYSKTRWSCGVMTPSPKPSCEPYELEIGGGYLAGARHLAVWLDRDHCRGNRVCALNGFAGSAVDHQVQGGHKTWTVFAWRAAWIRRERTHAVPGV